MIGSLSLSQLADVCQAKAPDVDVSFASVSTDSRAIASGDLFVALKGERFDGHDYIDAVASAGACAAVVESPQTCSLPQLVVNNCVKALGKLGALNRDRFNGPVLAITGSSGKTTVKEMLASVLSTQGDVLATRGNLNNHIGVPLTLLSISDHHQFAVIEMGASALGEIAYLAEMTRADISVVNNVGSAHVGGFGSVDNIAKGKGEIYRALGAEGVAVINCDDAYSQQWIDENSHCRQLRFSLAKNNTEQAQEIDVWASDICLNRNAQAKFVLHFRQQSISVQLPLLGAHHVYNSLAAATCALALGISLEDIKAGLESVKAASGRMQIKAGLNASRVIDDSYNANPDSVFAAIDAIKGMDGERILVLGDMAELGNDEMHLHKQVGEYAKQAQLDALYAVGPLTKNSVDAFGAGACHFESQQSLVERCKQQCSSAVVFLVKGSRSASMENVVEALSPEGSQC